MKSVGYLGLLALSVVGIALSGCGSDSSSPATNNVRVFNAAANNSGTPIVVSANGQVIANGTAFCSASSFAAVPVGSTVPFTVTQGGTTIATGNMNITQGNGQTLLVTSFPGGTGTFAPQIVALPTAENETNPTGSQARIYFVNAAQDAGTSSTATFTVAVNGGAATTVNNGFFAQRTDATLVAPGTATITGTVGGQTFTLNNVTLTGGQTYYFVLDGQTTAAGGNPALNICQITGP